MVPIPEDEPEEGPAEGGPDEPVTLLELPPGVVMELEADETGPDVSGAEEDELAGFDALGPWEDEGPASEL